ncbi:hypothetical protein SAMN05444406_10911 [Caldicoprobacter faecalis]|uniref:Flagellar Assembly Protein A N-terminal region domain-containing protein n=2 Tax=Caldicoprobacter faecalis TaxID=937334 RepID=A0A1I5UZI5_9FIRM|nr:hypothetical protein SAMN05444406_10911 [Caldicoprobacter faecalis]
MLFKADSVEEALSRAEKYYNCHRNYLRVYTIRPPGSMLWGIIRWRGVYRIEVSRQKREKVIESVKPIDGTVEIKDGVVRVKNPVSGGKYPSLIVNDQNIEVYINGQRAVGSCVVTERDWIQVIPKEIPPVSRVEVYITPDKMQAILKIERIPGKKYFLRDVKAGNSIVVSGDYEEIPPPDITVEQCIQELIKNGVLPEFILIEEIEKLLKLPRNGSAVVAKGRPPIDGVDARVKYFFTQHSYRNPDFDTDKKVDMMDHTIIPTVKVGEILAEKVVPAIPGMDGMTVTGEVIKARPAQEAVFKAGKGAMLLDNNRIVATIPGRPVLEKGVVSVHPVLTVPSDVNVDTGNIRFDGDVVVKGDVKDGLKVIAGGDIIIYGNCYHATIKAGRNVEIHGKVIKCKVTAGGNIVQHLFVLPTIGRINRELKAIVEKVTVMYLRQRNGSIGHVVYKLINENTKLKTLVEDIENILPLMEEEEASDILKLLHKIKDKLFGVNAFRIDSLDEIHHIYTELVEYENVLKQRYVANMNITFSYCENSLILASGSVFVTGRGSYQSKIVAKNRIIFKDPKSIVLGGMLVAGKGVKAGIVGSSAGVSTYCKIVDADGKFDAVYCYPDTILNINNKRVESLFSKRDTVV